MAIKGMEFNFESVNSETVQLARNLTPRAAEGAVRGGHGPCRRRLDLPVRLSALATSFESGAATVDTSKMYVKVAYFRVPSASLSNAVPVEMDHGSASHKLQATVTSAAWHLVYVHMEPTEGLAYDSAEYAARVAPEQSKFQEDGVYDLASGVGIEPSTICPSFVMQTAHTSHRVSLSTASSGENIQVYGEAIFVADGLEPSLAQLARGILWTSRLCPSVPQCLSTGTPCSRDSPPRVGRRGPLCLHKLRRHRRGGGERRRAAGEVCEVAAPGAPSWTLRARRS